LFVTEFGLCKAFEAICPMVLPVFSFLPMVMPSLCMVVATHMSRNQQYHGQAFPPSITLNCPRLTEGAGKGASFRLIVSGAIGVMEIERLIQKFEIDKEILADDGVDDSMPDE
jgi:hypothetical protein